ncbi:MAG: hypothetical protein FJ390_07240 [Verrucomicrobia bacterium]|nr:hypothetical protein [Verrucomicrobiota bacterium]
MIHSTGNSISRYDSIVPERPAAQDDPAPISSFSKKVTPVSSTWLRILSAIFPPRKIASSYQEETTNIKNDLLGPPEYKNKPTLESISTDSTDTNVTSIHSLYSTDGYIHPPENFDLRVLLIGKETDSCSLKTSTLKELDEQTIKKKYPGLYQEFRKAGTNSQRLCSFLAKFDTTNSVFEKNEEISSRLIHFFTQQTLKNLGIDPSKNPTAFQFATQVGKVLTDPKKRHSPLVLGRLQKTAFDLLEKENEPTKEPPLPAQAIAFLKFVSQTDTLDL